MHPAWIFAPISGLGSPWQFPVLARRSRSVGRFGRRVRPEDPSLLVEVES
jgi:hypothetical protein